MGLDMSNRVTDLATCSLLRSRFGAATCPERGRTQELHQRVQTPKYVVRPLRTGPGPPCIPSAPLIGARTSSSNIQAPSRRGPSLQASSCPWSPLSARTGFQCRHVARGCVAEAFGKKQTRRHHSMRAAGACPAVRWACVGFLLNDIGASDRYTRYQDGWLLGITVHRACTVPILTIMQTLGCPLFL